MYPVANGLGVDKPKNLVKSVTMESWNTQQE